MPGEPPVGRDENPRAVAHADEAEGVAAGGAFGFCMDLQGGFSIFKAGGFERLWRDARLVKIHPSNKSLTMEIVGKISLGISPDEAPRWG